MVLVDILVGEGLMAEEVEVLQAKEVVLLRAEEVVGLVGEVLVVGEVEYMDIRVHGHFSIVWIGVPHCFCGPCVVATPPTFFIGSAAPHISNAHKRYPLYHKFWQVLSDLGVWHHEVYLERKAHRTSVDDVREIMPTCILNVRKRSQVIPH